MGDLISRNWVRKALFEYLHGSGMKGLLDTLAAAPTIDAVEVVRCACCISFMEYAAEHKQAAEGADGDCRIRMNFSDYPDYYAVKKDDYCADGKRKEATDGRSD